MTRDNTMSAYQHALTNRLDVAYFEWNPQGERVERDEREVFARKMWGTPGRRLAGTTRPISTMRHVPSKAKTRLWSCCTPTVRHRGGSPEAIRPMWKTKCA